MTPGELFLEFFRTLEARGIPSVVLHSYGTFPELVTSDVDYTIPAADLGRLAAVEDEAARRAGWVVAQRFRHESTARSAVLVNPARPQETLMLDVATHYAREGRVFLRDKELLRGRRPHAGFFIPHPAVELVYVWAKIFAKRKDPAPLLPRLRELHRAAPAEAEVLFARLFGADAGSAAAWLERPVAEWRELAARLQRRSRPTLAWRARNLCRVAGRILRPTGFTIVFLGPDGAGKSTVIEAASRLLAPCFRREMRIHFIPRFGSGTPGAPVTNPHALPPRGTLASWAKIIFYFARHWAHWLLCQWPARIRTTLVIFDRTFVDLRVDPRRYRVKNSGWLVRLLAPLLPRPDLVFILDAPAEVIHARKPELDVPAIKDQLARLREFAAGHPRNHRLDAAKPAAEVAEQAVRLVVEALARRQERRA